MRLLAGLLFFAMATPRVADFRDIAVEAGLTAVFPNGGVETKQYIVETTGSGIAFFDYDNDGRPDLFVLSGPGGTNRLYHNEGGRKFRDVTEETGLRSSGWAQGVCAGDYDNDGFTDLFVTFYGANHLYRNRGGKMFEDVTAKAGLLQDRTRYNTGCAFLDYDNDGRLDLFVSNYLRFDPKTAPKPGENPFCYYRNIPVNCGPRGLPFDHNILYHNMGNGIFTDVSVASGIAAPEQHYSLGVLTGDFNNDGLTDIYVACDRTPSLLYINTGKGTFEEQGLFRGVALDGNGMALSGMGAAAADFNHDGRLDIFRTNFSDERETLYRNNGAGEYDDVTAEAGMAQNTRYVGWGCGFFDFDNDGFPDLLLVNGHAFPEIDRLKLDVTYKQRAILYRNLRNGKFADLSEAAGPGITALHSARGAAFADFDNDGLVEIAINNQNERPSLLKQAPNTTKNHWIVLALEGTRSNRSAIGAKVIVKAGALTQMDEVRSGGSYLSQNDLRLHFGLGQAHDIDEILLQWPSGARQVMKNIAADRVVSIREAQTSR